MDSPEFGKVLEEQIQRVVDILGVKRDEYVGAEKDHLSNFKASASLQGNTPIQALAGYMAKHTISIYAMMRSPHSFPLETWDEKITDHINYLILLRALIVEEDKEDAALGTGGTT